MLVQIEPTIHQFVVHNYVYRGDESLAADDSLIEGGLIDSMGILELVTFLEETFSLEVADEELIPENLDSIGQITAYVQRKLSPNGSQNGHGGHGCA